ncbi:Protein CBG27215 [Caenorhabditis briggsae]|uniref:Protein CBG27215 n=1 Tax=Caenorhabditis briggsae TaxID=6238 RepID=B6IIA8_CAEBR|nr:Protein CBG27215 [Caenorhabditis briggsae]CAR99638.1 Protein CBG27215 [Caenorhabditis briggsae]
MTILLIIVGLVLVDSTNPTNPSPAPAGVAQPLGGGSTGTNPNGQPQHNPVNANNNANNKSDVDGISKVSLFVELFSNFSETFLIFTYITRLGGPGFSELGKNFEISEIFSNFFFVKNDFY